MLLVQSTSPACGAVLDICKPAGTCSYDTIQAAVDDAAEGDTVSVGDGTYEENIHINGKALTLRSLRGPNFTAIRPVGGLDEGENTAVRLEATGPNSIMIEGFNINGGEGGWSVERERFEGSAISAYAASVVVRNCVVENNHGRGLYVHDGNLSVINSAIRNNTGAQAIYFFDAAPTDKAFLLAGSLIKGNGEELMVGARGGGIYYAGFLKGEIRNSRIVGNVNGAAVNGYGELEITGSVIKGNRHDLGSGGGSLFRGNLTVRRSTLSGNMAGLSGGGISIAGTLVLEDTEVTGNSAGLSGGGIAINGYYGKHPSYISGSTISGNTSGMDGGALWIDSELVPVILTNVIVSGNSGRSSAIYITGSPLGVQPSGWTHVDLVNSTVAGNVPEAFTLHGWAELSAVNSIVWGNALPFEPAGLRPDAARVMYSNVESPWEGKGNISVDSLFVAPVSWEQAPTSAGDYHLLEGSPCIDRGFSDSEKLPLLPLDDVDGDKRPVGSGYDMGADEVVSESERHAVPKIRANGSEGPVTLSGGVPLDLEVSLEARQRRGEGAEWWVLARTPLPPPGDWYHFDPVSRSWRPGMSVSRQGSCYDLKPQKILNSAVLPQGTYRFLFGIDMTVNGRPDPPEGYFDSTTVTIVP